MGLWKWILIIIFIFIAIAQIGQGTFGGFLTGMILFAIAIFWATRRKKRKQ